MINNNKILCIIPARSGSKGVKNKNVKLLNGRPLISYTINGAMKSNYIDEIIVTTDSIKIKKIAEKYGLEVPFLRPKKYSTDYSTANDVIMNCLKYFEKVKKIYQYFIYLQPTSPLRTSEHIDEAFELLFNDKKSENLVAVSEVKKHPIWMKRITNSGYLKNLDNRIKIHPNRQSLEKCFIANGSIYISRIESYKKYKSFYKGPTIPYLMNSNSSIDIDDIDDFKYAEYLLKNIK